MTRQTKKFIFTLSGVNIDKVNKKYGIDIVSNIEEDGKKGIPVNSTKICELDTTNKNIPEVVSFLDEAKRPHSCQVSMIDFDSGNDTKKLNYNCFWCRHPFETQGIGCPINYVSNKAIKRYYSEISKDTYTIKENITTNRAKDIQDDRIALKEGDYYETDGIFCSFNCCQSFINDNKHNRQYNTSTMLLTNMYNKMMGTKSVIIMPAPHWRMLSMYGGTMSIDKFRDMFNKMEYDSHGTIKQIPKFVSTGLLFEENLKF